MRLSLHIYMYICYVQVDILYKLQLVQVDLYKSQHVQIDLYKSQHVQILDLYKLQFVQAPHFIKINEQCI